MVLRTVVEDLALPGVGGLVGTIGDWLPGDSQGAMGTEDFLYLPRLKGSEPLSAPQGYCVFYICRPGGANGAVLIRRASFLGIYSLQDGYASPYTVMDTNYLDWRLTQFYQEANSDYPGKELLLKDLATIIVSLLLKGAPQCKVVGLAGGKTGGINSALEYISRNFHRKIVLEELAAKAHYSQYHFIRLFQKETGKTPFAYLTHVRMEKAKALLAASTVTITEIALKCGFQNSSHFANFFKTHTNQSPSEYRKVQSKRK